MEEANIQAEPQIQTVLPAVVDYSSPYESSPRYRFRRIPLNNFSTSTVTLSSAQNLLEWKIPCNVCNFARSYIMYETQYAAVALNQPYENASCLNIAQQVVFGNGSGLNLVDLQFANNYTRSALPLDISAEEYIRRGAMTQYYPNVRVFAGNVVPAGYTLQNGLAAPEANPWGVQNQANIAVPPSMTLAVQQLSPNIYGVNAAMNKYTLLQLKDYTGTFFETDKDSYFSAEMYLRLYTSPVQKIALQTPVQDNPDNGVVPTMAITLNNVYLYLAIEQNDSLAKLIVDEVMSGQARYQTPYTVAFRNGGSASASSMSVQLQVNRSYGKRLKRVLFTAYAGSGLSGEGGINMYDTSNMAAVKIINYNTYMDSSQLQDQIINCQMPGQTANVNGADDFRENVKWMQTSKDYFDYQLNWFHCDGFYTPNNYLSKAENVMLDEGLDMNSTRTWAIQAVVQPTLVYTVGGIASQVAGQPQLLNYYTFMQFVRDYQVTPTGFEWL